MSAPAEKARSPAPVTMIARTAASASSASNVSSMAAARAVLMAFSLAGRFRVRVAIPPAVTHRMGLAESVWGMAYSSFLRLECPTVEPEPHP
ncbi:hypothetical protein D3C71_1918650 [compost metagenome]